MHILDCVFSFSSTGYAQPRSEFHLSPPQIIAHFAPPRFSICIKMTGFQAANDFAMKLPFTSSIPLLALAFSA
jgi:hypothetical protein